MTKKTFEFTTWPCSDKYADDPKTGQSAFRALLEPKRVKGLNTIFNGVEKEKQIGHAVLSWDSLHAHKNFLADKERQAAELEKFANNLKGGSEGVVMEHVVLSAHTTLLSLEAPLTEIIHITFSDTASLEKVKAAVDKFVTFANKKETLPVAAAFGQTVNLGNVEELKVILVIGWKTAEDQEAARKSDELIEFGKEVSQVKGFEEFTIHLDVVLKEAA